MEGHSKDDITFTQNVKKSGYETVVPLKTDNALYLAANALAADGTILATSDVWDMTLKKSVSHQTQIHFFLSRNLLCIIALRLLGPHCLHFVFH